jgi:hypothetical protein
MTADTGFSAQDAQSDFNRARRRRALANLSRRLRRLPDDVDQILPFDEVVAALGKVGERRLGLQTIPLDSIVGTVDRSREFDRSFRPTSRRLRQRWERIAKAMRRGEAMPPIEVYRIGDMHFVVDGHHRVSVARALGWDMIDAYVTEIVTSVGADGNLRLRDLATKSHQRLFFERVPLPPDVRRRIQLRNRLWYAALAEGVEAWGMRAMQVERKFMSREEVAVAWYRDEYAPVVRMLDEAGLIGDNTEAEAYLKLSSLRYLLLRTHDWDEGVLDHLREELARPPSREDDTLVHQMRELGR